jgi:hypothetical protein
MLAVALILSHLTEGQIFSPLPRKALAFAVSLSHPTTPSLGRAPPLPATVDEPHQALPSCASEPCQPSHDPKPPPREQSPKSSAVSAARHLFHGHLIDDRLVQPSYGPASMLMSFPPSPRSSPNPKPAATTTERPPHQHSPTAKAHHHGQPNPYEPLPSLAPQIRPHLTVVFPDPLAHRLSQPATRIDGRHRHQPPWVSPPLYREWAASPGMADPAVGPG